MGPLVTIAMPVYKRLDYLVQALESVNAQDYENLDILVSDNGLQKEALDEVLGKHLLRPHRVRRNEKTYPLIPHFNQLVAEAKGEYFVVLPDDDELAPDYVSVLVEEMESDPLVSLGLARLDVMDDDGVFVPRRTEREDPPKIMEGNEFIDLWCERGYDFVTFGTCMMRTADLRRVGGYPDFPNGNGSDNALVVQLAMGRRVLWSSETFMKYRVYEASTGLAASYQDLAESCRRFMSFLDHDPALREYGRTDPGTWKTCRRALIGMTWRTYRFRWRTMYRNRLSVGEWVRAAFQMPFIPEYYSSVMTFLGKTALAAGKRRLTGGRA